MRNFLLILGFIFGVSNSSWGMIDTPDVLDVKVYDFYKKRTDGEAGRYLLLSCQKKEQLDKAQVMIYSKYGNEKINISKVLSDSIPILLPPQIGVNQTDTIIVSLINKGEQLTKSVLVPAMRHWTVYIYPHSHVDIGYTNTQENVEFIHKRNLDVAIDLAEKTRNYPEGSQFCWNTEVVWPVERYLQRASSSQKKRLFNAIKKGYISVDAGYINTNTSASNDEELLQLFSFGKKIEKETGVSIKTMVQTDIPGMSWGIIPAANQLGIQYVLSLFNGGDRVGLSPSASFRPFWWVGPDGKSKVLFLQPGSYNPGAILKGRYFWPKLAGQTDTTKLIPIVKTDNPRENFVDAYLEDMLPKLEKDKEYPYDIFPMTWCMADNTPIDVDLPEAVKSWNEEFAYPRLKICTATEMMEAFEKRWGNQLPVKKGDFTEYWTDGLGSSAEKTGQGREVKEKLVQAEILWSMLHPNEEEPQKLAQEAWRNMLLSTEHTWAFMDPYKQPIQDNILATKYGYFDKALLLTNQLMQEAYKNIEDKNSDHLSVFNTDSWEKSSLVTLPGDLADKYGRIVDEKGNEVLSQRLSTGEWVFIAEQVPALGYRSYFLKKGKANVPLQKKEKQNSNPILENDLVKITLDSLTGDIISLQYADNEFVDKKAVVALNSYRYLKGSSSSGYAYKPSNVRIYIGEQGPIVNSLIVKSDAEGCNDLSREVRLIQGCAGVELINKINKRATLEKEGIHFGFAFDIPNSKINVDIPWGVMELEKEQLPFANRNWIAMQRWLDVSNANKGVIWCSMNAYCFESGDMAANILGGAYNSPAWIKELCPSSTIYSWALNNHWHTNFRLSQDGIIGFKYHILPYVGRYDVVRSNQFAIERFRPLIPVLTKKEFSMQNKLSINGSEKVVLTNYISKAKGKVDILHLRSLSETEELVSLTWDGKQKPQFIIYSKEGKEEKLNPSEYILISPKSFVSISVQW